MLSDIVIRAKGLQRKFPDCEPDGIPLLFLFSIQNILLPMKLHHSTTSSLRIVSICLGLNQYEKAIAELKEEIST